MIFAVPFHPSFPGYEPQIDVHSKLKHVVIEHVNAIRVNLFSSLIESTKIELILF